MEDFQKLYTYAEGLRRIVDPFGVNVTSKWYHEKHAIWETEHEIMRQQLRKYILPNMTFEEDAMQ